MAVIKQACPKCGQRVSGDESFYGTHVECPICTSKIFFPDPNEKKGEQDEASKSKRRSASDSDSKSDAKSDKSSSDKKGDRDSGPPPLGADEKAKSGDGGRHDDFQAPSPAPRPPTTAYAEPPSATLSIISMVLGILNAVTFCIPAILLAPASIICGHIALIKGKFSPIQPAPGRSMAITGLILGYLGMAVMLVALGLAVTGIFNIFEWFRFHFGGGVHTGDGKGG